MYDFSKEMVLSFLIMSNCCCTLCFIHHILFIHLFYNASINSNKSIDTLPHYTTTSVFLGSSHQILGIMVMENIWFLAWTEKRVGGCSEHNEGCLERESMPASLMWASQRRVHCWKTFLKQIVKYRIQRRRQTRKREDTYMGTDFLSKNQKLSFFASATYHI